MQDQRMDRPIVHLSEGSLRGCKKVDLNGQEFYSFEGIPYGEPPVGKLRFKAPVPVKPWKGVRDALIRNQGNLQKSVCFKQHAMVVESECLIGSEDCLNLNVYTRQLPEAKNTQYKPVMFYVHGGGFTLGSTEVLGPERLLTEDIVLVTIHYRLGALGFLVLEDPSLGVTGNAALKDQVLALKWVQRNIAVFNGDPRNVTIFGHSAGGASISLLVLSPTTSGLFHRAIFQSGTALNTWSWGHPQNAKHLAETLGFQKTSQEDLLQFLQDLPAEELYKGQLKLKDNIYTSRLRTFSPVIEHQNLEHGAFLTEEPEDLLRSGKYNQVPIIIGFTDIETANFLIKDENNPLNLECLDEIAQTPLWLGLKEGSEDFIEVTKKIRKFYYGDVEPELFSEPTIKMSSDAFFNRDIIKFARLLVSSSTMPVYFYRIKLPVILPEPFATKKIFGSPHGTEIPLLFKLKSDIKFVSGDDEVIRKRMLKLWTNFAKYGNPTPNSDNLISVTWKPLEMNNFHFLNIGCELTMRVDPEKRRMNFWNEIFQTYEQSAAYRCTYSTK